MSSTYSELKFELMGTGENAGTWGNVTNTNLGVAINEAIANLAPVDTGTTNYTLPWLNVNTTQAARHFGLNLYTTGSHGSPYDVNVPAIQKPYMVNNSSGAVATVKISGGSGVAVPNNKTTMVYANGSNVTQMFNYVPDLTVGTFSATTAIPLASGGTGVNTISSGIVTSDGSALGSVPAPAGDLVGTTEVQTLTNKTIQSRISLNSFFSGPTFNPDNANFDMLIATSQFGSLTFGPASSPPFNGQKMIFRVTASSTVTIAFDLGPSGYRAIGVTLPTSLASGLTMYIGCIWNSTISKWDVVAVNTGA